MVPVVKDLRMTLGSNKVSNEITARYYMPGSDSIYLWH